MKGRVPFVPRVLRGALKRFGTTRNVQDTSTAMHNTCEPEAARLDSELAMLRFSVWAMLHEIQLAQERLVLDPERYADEQLVARLSSR